MNKSEKVYKNGRQIPDKVVSASEFLFFGGKHGS